MNEYLCRLLYITTPNKEEAARIAHQLLEQRLAACANIIPSMQSYYWWEGKIQQSEEAILLVKTNERLVDKIIEIVRALHLYDCPAILSLPIDHGNPDFLAWIYAETVKCG